MRNRIVICVGLILGVGTHALAQDPPPPGFAPAQDGPVQNAPVQDEGSRSGSFFSQFNQPPQDTRLPSYDGGADQQGRIQPDPYVSDLPYQQQTLNTVLPPDGWPSPRLWIKAEGLYFWSKAAPVPVPLVTIGSAGDSIPGALGQPGTSVLMGNQDLSLPGRGGGRFSLGFTLDPEQVAAFEATYFFVGTSSASQSVFSDGSSGSALLAIPFFNPVTHAESSTSLANPGSWAGSALLSVDSFFQGAEANLFVNLPNSTGLRFDMLGGFRYLNLQENLTFQTNSPAVTGPADVFQTFDHFQTSNNFYGGQLGARATFENSRLFANVTGKVALGGTQEYVRVNGATYTNDFNGFGSVVAFPGGYFAQSTNIGSQSRTVFAVVPEANLNFGIRMSPWASFIVGYTFLYVSSVARPGDQIDRVINPSQAASINGLPNNLIGPARPALAVQSTDFWVQGLSFSLELRY
jgi:hypothetical protein